MVGDEAAIIVQRQNMQIASEAIAFKAAASAVISEGGGQHFDDVIDRLMGD